MASPEGAKIQKNKEKQPLETLLESTVRAVRETPLETKLTDQSHSIIWG